MPANRAMVNLIALKTHMVLRINGKMKMSTITDNSTITISYIGKLDNGEIFKTVDKDNPLVVTLGNHDLPPTLENALKGLSEGDTKKVRLTPDEGYGGRQKMLLQEISLKSFGDKITPKPGMILSLKIKKEGQAHQVPATVIEIKNDIVTVDYNHPLAGHHLTYEVDILKVENN